MVSRPHHHAGESFYTVIVRCRAQSSRWPADSAERFALGRNLTRPARYSTGHLIVGTGGVSYLTEGVFHASFSTTAPGFLSSCQYQPVFIVAFGSCYYVSRAVCCLNPQRARWECVHSVFYQFSVGDVSIFGGVGANTGRRCWLTADGCFDRYRKKCGGGDDWPCV